MPFCRIWGTDWKSLLKKSEPIQNTKEDGGKTLKWKMQWKTSIKENR